MTLGDMGTAMVTLFGSWGVMRMILISVFALDYIVLRLLNDGKPLFKRRDSYEIQMKDINKHFRGF